jgi:stage III sporulation protein AA
VIEVIDSVTKILPNEIKESIETLKAREEITEIRLRVGKNVRAYLGGQEKELNTIVSKQDLIKILSNISSNSIYSVQNDINKGFVTIEGGNRIGIAGEIVVVDGKIKNVKEISSMNIRISKEFIGISDGIMDNIVQDGLIKNTIIISPPGLGKTTLLRDIIRNLSGEGYNVSLIDERGEIAAMYEGKASLNLGDRTDVISFVDKSLGMQMAVRSLAPDVVCTDEIGNERDVEAVKYLCKSGVSFITTMHGKCLEDIKRGPMKKIIDEGYLDTVIILSKKCGIGSIEKIYTNLNAMEEVVC